MIDNEVEREDHPCRSCKWCSPDDYYNRKTGRLWWKKNVPSYMSWYYSRCDNPHSNRDFGLGPDLARFSWFKCQGKHHSQIGLNSLSEEEKKEYMDVFV